MRTPPKSAWGREAARSVALCLAFTLFHCALYAALRSCLLFARLRWRGYADYSEQKTFKDFVEENYLARSLALLLLCGVVALVALRAPLTAAPFLTAGLLFYAGLGLARGLRLDPLKWL